MGSSLSSCKLSEREVMVPAYIYINKPKFVTNSDNSQGFASAMINDLLGINIEVVAKNDSDQIKAPGLLESHYSPKAKVYLSGTPSSGDGFIALSKFPTPAGVVRLISPATNEEYARNLYKGLRLADSKNLNNVFVIPPIGDDISVAVCDRLQKAAADNSDI